MCVPAFRSRKAGNNRFSIPGWDGRNTRFYPNPLFTQFGRMAQEKVTPGWIDCGHHAWLHPRIVDDPHPFMGDGSGKREARGPRVRGGFGPSYGNADSLAAEGGGGGGSHGPVPATRCMRPWLKVHGRILKALTFRPPLKKWIRRKILYASKTLAGVTVQMEDYAPTFSARSFSREADEDHTESETPSRQAAPGASEPDPGG